MTTRGEDGVLAVNAFARDVAEYLRRSPRQLPSKYLYDELGSALFDAICHLPWYRVTRAESALLRRHAGEMLAPADMPFAVAELGCGNGQKLATLLEHAAVAIPAVPHDAGRAAAGARPGGAGVAVEDVGGSFNGGDPHVQLVDISRAALRAATDRLADYVGTIVTHQSTYEEGLARIAVARPPAWPLTILFLGSNIGNFDPAPAGDLLRAIRHTLREGDALLLGSDLVKPERDLLLAYDDPLQVTAAFNRNLLRRINEELGGTFRLECFAHRAVWNARERRVEMHLVSRRPQVVRVAAADLTIAFDADEWIWTESSYKYDADEVIASGLAAGFSVAGQWIDGDARFAVTRFTV